MGEDGPWPAGQDGGGGPVDRAKSGMADGVDATVDPMKTAALDAVTDRSARQPEFQELRSSHISVLPGGDLRDFGV